MREAKQLRAAEQGDFLTTDEAARALGIKSAAIRNYLYAGKLTTYKFKSLTLLSRQEVEAWKKRQRRR
jgi:excisionase family DNA binding protein